LFVGHLYYREGKFQDASNEYRKAIDMLPTYAAAFAGLANVAYKQGHLDSALVQYQKAFQLDPDLGSDAQAPLAYQNYVDVLSQKGRSSEASEIQHKFSRFFNPGKNPDVGLIVSSQEMGRKKSGPPWDYWIAGGGMILAAAVGALLYWLLRRPPSGTPPDIGRPDRIEPSA
jgi:tetratricopeptide (TPR) repeat protein